jgi:hypothetical protein
MLRELPDMVAVEQSHILYPIFCVKPTVRILFYTDSSQVQMNTTSDFGVGMLRDLIVNNNPFYVNFQIDLLNRHAGGHAMNKLTPALLATYDQVWFFGILQANTTSALENELVAAEVTALQSWMSDGGVLMTGDHANPKPFGAAAGLDPLVNLGRAIGFKVPRAGQLRKWEGLPSANAPDENHNTQVPNPPGNMSDIDTLNPQDDEVPQQLILKTYGLGFFPYFFKSRPHPLFCGRTGVIRVFPDHMHEGMLTIPSTLNSEWPAVGSLRPRPDVIAWGTDKRNGSVYPVVSAYDGDSVSVGRIVADATWHHYFNINLRGFPVNGDGTPGTVLAKIANYFVNLAVWLSPKAKRRAMRCSIIWYIANHPQVLEVKYSHLYIVGRTAFDVLGRWASQCELWEFFYPSINVLTEKEFRVPPVPPEEFIIGGIIQQYHLAMDEAALGKRPASVEQLSDAGIKQAFELHTTELQQLSGMMRTGLKLFLDRDAVASPKTSPKQTTQGKESVPRAAKKKAKKPRK